jgi:hypothetical protein
VPADDGAELDGQRVHGSPAEGKPYSTPDVTNDLQTVVYNTVVYSAEAG